MEPEAFVCGYKDLLSVRTLPLFQALMCVEYIQQFWMTSLEEMTPHINASYGPSYVYQTSSQYHMPNMYPLPPRPHAKQSWCGHMGRVSMDSPQMNTPNDHNTRDIQSDSLVDPMEIEKLIDSGMLEKSSSPVERTETVLVTLSTSKRAQNSSTHDIMNEDSTPLSGIKATRLREINDGEIPR